jgi:hypothetical protein
MNLWSILVTLRHGTCSWKISNFCIRSKKCAFSIGIVIGVSHQGYNTYPICGPNFRGEHFVKLGKMTYISTHKWLPDGHPYKLARMKSHFNGQLETWSIPKSVIVEEQLATTTKYQSWLRLGNRDGGVGDPSKQRGVKWLSILYDLPYWQVCLKATIYAIRIPFTFVCNCCKSLFGTWTCVAYVWQ